jgi:hypothetical protein
MSSWDHGEALKLKVHGNDYARKVWLATAPPPGVGGRPREGDDIDVFKRFVVDAYERRRYYREPDSSGGGSDGNDRGTDVVGAAGKGTTVRSSMPSPTPATALNAPPVHTPPTVAPAAVVDLLDFGAFDTPASVVNSAPTAASASDTFFDPFNDNSAPMATDVSSQSTSAAATSSSNNNNHINTNGNSSANFDAFAPSMNGTSMANNISSMQSSNNSAPDPFSVLAGTSAIPTNSWGMMPMNPNSVSNFNNSSAMMNGGSPGVANNNMMMINGGGMMNNGNVMMMNGNYNVMNSRPAMMINGGFDSMMHNGGGVNSAVMNPMIPPTMVMPATMQQQQYSQQQPPQSIIMNSRAGTSMFNSNSISNNFSTGTTGNTKSAATSSSSAKPDPFAGLMGL